MLSSGFAVLYVLYAHFRIDRSTEFYFVYTEIPKTTRSAYVSTRRRFGLFINYVHNLFRFYRLLYTNIDLLFLALCTYITDSRVRATLQFIIKVKSHTVQKVFPLSLENGGELIYGVPYRQRPCVVITATPSSIQLTSYTNKHHFMRRVLLIWQAKQFL